MLRSPNDVLMEFIYSKNILDIRAPFFSQTRNDRERYARVAAAGGRSGAERDAAHYVLSGVGTPTPTTAAAIAATATAAADFGDHCQHTAGHHHYVGQRFNQLHQSQLL